MSVFSSLFGFLNGYKTHALGLFAIIVGLLKLVFDIPEIEAISLLGVEDATDLISAGWMIIAGRSALNKVGDG